MPEISAYERGRQQGIKDAQELDHDIRQALAQALGEQKVRITDRRMLILYIVNVLVLILVVVALFAK